MDHTIVHFEIPAENPENLRRFYSKLFGWKIEKTEGMEYWLIETVPVDEKGMPIRPGVNGGMMKKESPDQRPVNYIQIESVDTYSKRVEELGGKIIVPKQEVPGMGYFALALDPDGNVFGLWEEKAAPK